MIPITGLCNDPIVANTPGQSYTSSANLHLVIHSLISLTYPSYR